VPLVYGDTVGSLREDSWRREGEEAGAEVSVIIFPSVPIMEDSTIYRGQAGKYFAVSRSGSKALGFGVGSGMEPLR